MSRRLWVVLAIFLGGVMTIAGLAGHSHGDERVVLKHDDGTMESKRSTTGGGHAVLFECPGEGSWSLDKIELFGARYGHDKAPDADFYVSVTDPSMENFCEIAFPYKLFEKGAEKWHEIDLPPVEVPSRFYVCVVFDPTSTKGVYVGLDENADEVFSQEAVPGSHMTPVQGKANWMIRAHLTRGVEDNAVRVLSAEEREAARLADVQKEDSRLLKGKEACILKHDDGEMDAHFSYGGTTAQTVVFDAPSGFQFVYGVSVYGSLSSPWS